MAIIQTSELISDIKGSIGGTTFSRNNAGLTAKRKYNGKRNVTSKQLNQIQDNIAITNLWNTLTLEQKIVWNSYALAHNKTDRYGVIKNLSGFNWFVLLNSACFFLNGTYVTAPPAYSLPSALPSFTITASVDDLKIKWSTPINTTNLAINVFTSAPIRGAAKYSRAYYRMTPLNGVDYSDEFSIKLGWEEAHNLIFNDIITNSQFNINCLIYPINKTSYVTGTSVTNINETISTGIGSMIIGDTFIVE